MNVKRISSLLLSIAVTMLIGVFVTAVVAQEDAPQGEPPSFIERFDQNSDGVVTIEEFTGPEAHLIAWTATAMGPSTPTKRLKVRHTVHHRTPKRC